MFLILNGLDDPCKPLGHFFKCVFPAEVMGEEPAGECVTIVTLPTIPVAIPWALDSPAEFLAALYTLAMLVV